MHGMELADVAVGERAQERVQRRGCPHLPNSLPSAPGRSRFVSSIESAPAQHPSQTRPDGSTTRTLPRAYRTWDFRTRAVKLDTPRPHRGAGGLDGEG